MATRTKFRDLVQDAKSRYDYVAHNLSIDFAIHLNDAMRKNQISRAELARRVECTPAYVTKVLRGDANFTLRTMAKLAHGANLDIKLDLRSPESASTANYMGRIDAAYTYSSAARNLEKFKCQVEPAMSAGNDDEYSRLAA